MSDHIHIEKGWQPWSPSESSELVEVFHEFTIPLVGLIRQQGIDYVFWCVVGATGPESTWAYARVVDGDRLTAIREANSLDFDDALRALVDGRVCSFAIASEEKGVIEWVELDPPAKFDDAHERGMQEIGIKVAETMKEMEHLMEQYPSIRAASTFSIAPSTSLV